MIVAQHYAQAGLAEPALQHWQAAAARAISRSAYVEAIHSLDQALSQLALLAPGEARDRRELELQVMKLGPLYAVKGYASSEIDATSGRALTLCRSLGDRATLPPVLYARWAFQYVRGRQQEVFALSQEYLEAARAAGDDAALIVGHRIHAVALLMRGDAEGARGLARQALSLYVPERHQPLIARFGQDLKVQALNYLAVSQALLGRVDEARGIGDEAIRHARGVDHVNTLAYALWHCGVWLPAILRETDALRRRGAELLDLAREHRLGFWEALARPFLLEGEEAERAVSVYRREFNAGLLVPEMLCRVADAYAASGLMGEATRVLAEAQELMERDGEVYWEPELLRLRGRLAAAEGRGVLGPVAAEFRRALALARDRGVGLLALRAATDLARLEGTEGHPAEAYRLLSPLVSSFGEGCDTADLREARPLLAGFGP